MASLLKRLVIIFVLLTATAWADDQILTRIGKLQATARLANGGALGCGVGSVTLVTSRGEVTVTSGLDTIHVFGNKVALSEIHILLKSRADSNREGSDGPMAGDVGDLCYVCLSTLALAKDPESIPVVVPLLQDPNKTVQEWAGVALKAIGDSDPALQKTIDDLKEKQGVEDTAPEPPPAAAVLESSETMNPKPESEAPSDGGGR